MSGQAQDSLAMRDEQTIFAELSVLCRSAGYVHAIAYLCYRDNMVGYSGAMTSDDMGKLFSQERLIRTEVSTLIGLMVQGEMDLGIPTSGVIENYVEQTEALLRELHQVLASPMFSGFDPDNPLAPDALPAATGQVLREPIFYSGESAYSFQYRDFASPKYSADDPWLLANKGFTAKAARDVVEAVGRYLDQQAVQTLLGLRALHPDLWTLLPMFKFNPKCISDSSGIDLAIVKSVLAAFALPRGDRNETFTGLQEFSATNAYPLIQLGEHDYLLFQYYSLAEALYETPFFWMWEDLTYRPTAVEHRGQFTEQICLERLEVVFGKKNVHPNVDIYVGKARVSEIDTLVLFGNRAVVIQAKSKRLTLLARKGHDGQIREDFQKSVQESYDQGLACAKLLLENKAKFLTSGSAPLEIPSDLAEIYVCCVVSDHYPALSFQSQQFLKAVTTKAIPSPLVLDVFALDAMTEMLRSPLHFLCYLERRARYSGKVMATHELNLLGYHLSRNLWMEGETDFLFIQDDLSVDLDVAMAVRRDGIPGKATPDGILTRFEPTTLGRIVKQIQTNPDPAIFGLGLLLLSLSEETVKEVSEGIQHIARLARSDGKGHDLTIGISEGNTGLTVHCNADPSHVSAPKLRNHCERRKYSRQADTWFGICLHPKDNSLRFGLSLAYEWKPNPRLEHLTRALPPGRSRVQYSGPISSARKVGRNDTCPCGSGLKYKKCCLV